MCTAIRPRRSTFWGLKPGMTILEVQPGGGWWTEILAPYAKANKGEFYATAADLDDPGHLRKARARAARISPPSTRTPAIYGKVNLVNWGAKAAPLPANKFDFVLAARVFHGWSNGGARMPTSPSSSPASSRAASSPSNSIAAIRARNRR